MDEWEDYEEEEAGHPVSDDFQGAWVVLEDYDDQPVGAEAKERNHGLM